MIISEGCYDDVKFRSDHVHEFATAILDLLGWIPPSSMPSISGSW